MALETFSNNGQTLLNGSIDNSQTTITIDDSSTFPPHSTGKFRIKIDDELIRCEVNSATSTELINCERGIEGSTAAAHADNTPVKHVLTAGALQEITQVQMSITRDDDGISLVGDTSSPGNNKVYGTDGSGTRGWYDPAAGTVKINAIDDADGATTINCGSNDFTLSAYGSDMIAFTDSATTSTLTLAPEQLTITAPTTTISSTTTNMAGNINISTDLSNISFFGGTGTAQMAYQADATDETSAIDAVNAMLAYFRLRGDFAASPPP